MTETANLPKPPEPSIIGLLGYIIKNHPIMITLIIITTLILIGAIVYLVIKNAKGLKVGDFQVDFSKGESIHGDTGKNAEEINEVRRQVEERTRYTISRQFAIVPQFLQSLRPIFNRLVYSILDDAVADSLNIQKELRETTGKEKVDGSSYYLVETVKTYMNEPKTRTFTNLVESTVDSMLCDLEIEIYKMLVANNIGKTKEEVQIYVKSRSENLIGIIRNSLCDAYNELSNKNLFDTHKYWAATGITYPEDWIADEVYKLLKNCMNIRYSDFN